MHLVFPSSELCLANMCDSDKYAIEYELQRQNGEKKIREKRYVCFLLHYDAHLFLIKFCSKVGILSVSTKITQLSFGMLANTFWDTL